VKGGGNVGNALTAASRLGLNTRIFTKVISLSRFRVEGTVAISLHCSKGEYVGDE
jgi:hypothetical protein